MKSRMRENCTYGSVRGSRQAFHVIKYKKGMSRLSTRRTQKVLDTKDRIIHVGNETMFYLYAICDVTATLETILYRRGFTKMADGLGYYWHNSPLNAYIKVLPFNKILIDSKKRNKILFDKLGIE